MSVALRIEVFLSRWSLDHRAVVNARALMDGIARRLTAPAPVGVRGVALISDMIGDGASPLYVSGWTRASSNGALANRLRSAGRALELSL
jgi:hypothetical protein